MADPLEEFWQFAIHFYARPGVAPACLELQDRHGKDVLIALYACWLGLSGRGRLDETSLAAAEATTGPWRRLVVEPLRRTRHGLKGIPGAEELYERMKKIELDAERLAMGRLAPLAPPPEPAQSNPLRAAAARANLMLYAGKAADAAGPIAAALG
ncbi:MAG: TIGR02444 family protein [Stellaceae bacterium]